MRRDPYAWYDTDEILEAAENSYSAGYRAASREYKELNHRLMQKDFRKRLSDAQAVLVEYLIREYVQPHMARNYSDYMRRVEQAAAMKAEIDPWARSILTTIVDKSTFYLRPGVCPREVEVGCTLDAPLQYTVRVPLT